MRRQISVQLTNIKYELPKIFASFVITYLACVLILGNDYSGRGRKIVEESSDQRCQSPEKVLFVKCPKCSSNTAAAAISKILLKTETPISEPFGSLSVDNDKDTLVLDLDSSQPWNYAKVIDLLGPRAVIVTILADPVDQFIDTLDQSSLKLDIKGLVKLIQSKRFKDKQLNIKKEMHEFRQTIGWMNGNSMIHDFGMPSHLDADALEVDEFIAQLDRQMHLVLMSDRLEESLALLRRQLCWSEEELLSTIDSLDVYLHKSQTSRYKLEPEERDQLRKWLGSADDQLYRHFSEMFDLKLDSFAITDEEIERIRQSQ